MLHFRLQHSPWWWPLPQLSARSAFFVLVWPFVVHLLLRFLASRANRSVSMVIRNISVSVSALPSKIDSQGLGPNWPRSFPAESVRPQFCVTGAKHMSFQSYIRPHKRVET